MAIYVGTCPECHQPNSYDAVDCIECGARLPWGDAVSAAALQSENAKSTISSAAKPPLECFQCSYQLTGVETHCPGCGDELKPAGRSLVHTPTAVGAGPASKGVWADTLNLPKPSQAGPPVVATPTQESNDLGPIAAGCLIAMLLGAWLLSFLASQFTVPERPDYSSAPPPMHIPAATPIGEPAPRETVEQEDEDSEEEGSEDSTGGEGVETDQIVQDHYRGSAVESSY